MGNLFCKQTSTPANSDLATAIEPTGTNFLHFQPHSHPLDRAVFFRRIYAVKFQRNRPEEHLY